MPERADSGSIVVLTSLADAEQARTFVRRLVDARVVACGTVVEPATSVYRWDGEVTETSEALVLLKTRRACWDLLEEEVRQRHPYDVPELLALPVVAGLPSYLAWMAGETQAGGEVA